MCGIALALLSGLKWLLLISEIHLFVLFCARGKTCEHLFFSHEGDIPCYAYHGHIAVSVHIPV